MNKIVKSGTIAIFIITTVVCAMIGVYYRRSYTDITKQPGFMQEIKVCEVTEDTVMNLAGILKEDAGIVLRVKAYGEVKYDFYNIRQRVQVQEVFKGSTSLVGQDIYICKGSWFMNCDGTRNMGFVNEMKKDDEYLVFITEKIKNLKGEIIDTYDVVDTIITPVFNYENTENVIIPWEHTEEGYVKYQLVENNEFFVASQEALNVIVDMKEELLNSYPKKN